ncbi:MAG: LCP family protein [Bacillota bacterium]|nr:LCP family protein [Bacillota bacterium]
MTNLNKKKIVLLFIVVFIGAFGVGVLIGKWMDSHLFASVESRHLQGKAINILFMGIDARDTESNSRSDTMMVVSIDPETKNIAIVSIPRDTRIINRNGASDKINGVNYIEGPEDACKAVSELLDTKIDEYVVTNFDGFANIIDILGGVNIDVEENMVHTDDINPELAINISKGQQHLDGQQALNYVRYRGGPTADIGRTQRQQKFVKAIVEEMFKTRNILKLTRLVPEIAGYVHTNLPIKDMIYLAGMAKDFEQSTISAQTLPGYPYSDPKTGASYWEVDKETAAIILPSLLAGEFFDVAIDPPPGMRPISQPVQSVPETSVETMPDTEPAEADETADTNGETESEGEQTNQEPQEVQTDQEADSLEDELIPENEQNISEVTKEPAAPPTSPDTNTEEQTQNN